MNTHSGFDEKRLSRISTAVARYIGPGKIPGTVSLAARNREIFHYEAQGVMNLESGIPMARDTIFRIHSMVKPITTVAVMILFEAGEFHLTNSISRFFPTASKLKVLDEKTGELVDLIREVTIRDLLSHTAGFSYPMHDNSQIDKMYREMEGYISKPLNQFVEEVFKLPLVFQPGTNWRYSISHDILARIVEITSGQAYEDFIMQNILQPLGMVDTDYSVPTAKLSRLATMYGALNIEDQEVTTNAQRKATAEGKIKPLVSPSTKDEKGIHNTVRGGHGLFSTAHDFYRFCQMLLDGGEFDGHRIICRKSVELMTRNMLQSHMMPYDDPPKFGCGFGYGMNIILDTRLWGYLVSEGSYSWGGAASTSFFVDPIEKIIAIQLAQFQPYGFFPIVDDFRIAIYQALI